MPELILKHPRSYAYSELIDLVETNKIDIALIDEAVKNILRVKFKAGLFDKPYKAPAKVSSLIHTDKQYLLHGK